MITQDSAAHCKETWGHVLLQCQSYKQKKSDSKTKLNFDLWYILQWRSGDFLIFYLLNDKSIWEHVIVFYCYYYWHFMGLSWLRLFSWLWLPHSESRDRIDERNRLKNMHIDLSSRFVCNQFYTVCPCQRAGTSIYFLKNELGRCPCLTVLRI